MRKKQNLPKSACFDSTYFGDGSPIPIKMLVWDSTGNKYAANVSFNAYKQAYVLGNHNRPAGTFAADYITVRAMGMNHTTDESYNDDKPTITANLPQ